MEPRMELDGDQHGYIAKYGSFTSGVLQRGDYAPYLHAPHRLARI